MMFGSWLALLTYLALIEVGLGAQVKLGVLLVETPESQELLCIKYFPQLHNLSSSASSAVGYKLSQLVDLTDKDTCSEESSELDLVGGNVGLVSSNGNCSIAERALNLEEHHGQGLLADSTLSSKFNASEFEPTNHFVASLVDSEDLQVLLNLKEKYPDAEFLIYSPNKAIRDEVDGSIFIIFFMAVFTVAIGSLWSGYYRDELRVNQAISLSLNNTAGSSQGTSNRQNGGTQNSSGSSNSSTEHKEEADMHVTPIMVILFVVCMCTFLLCLYFFYSYLVYFILVIFVIATISSTYACIEPFVLWTYRKCPGCICVLPQCNLHLCKVKFEVRQLLLMIFSIALSVVWVVNRHQSWAWIFQDILGILFSINMLKTFRLPNFKICVILLSSLFFYDIFFVFITPLITQDGKSIMVEVATGGDAGEQLPMVLKVPYTGQNHLRVCGISFSMLGYGDILVPGLLMSYCHGFDLLKRKGKIKLYWILSNLCYAISLLVCFVGLYLMNYAQPALLYIVPGTLIPVALLALIRGELKDFWRGNDSLEQSLRTSPGSPTNPERDNHDGSSNRRGQKRKASATDEEAIEPAKDIDPAASHIGDGDLTEESESHSDYHGKGNNRRAKRKVKDDVKGLLD